MGMLPLNRIVPGDCIDVMGRFPGDSIDLTVTSPPYDKLRDYEGYKFDAAAIGRALLRVTKPGGVVVWVVGDHINGGRTMTSFRQAIMFQDIGIHRPRYDDLSKKEHAVHALQRLHQLLGVDVGAGQRNVAENL